MPQQQALLTRFVEGRVLTSDDVAREGVLARTASAIARLHAAPAFPGMFCPFAVVTDYFRLAKSHDVPLPTRLHEVFDRLDDLRHEVAHHEAPGPCHNDLLPANLIDDGTSVRIIDWEYAGMGDRFFDLGNFAENHRLTAAQEIAFLHAYAGVARARRFVVCVPCTAYRRCARRCGDLRRRASRSWISTSSTMRIDISSVFFRPLAPEPCVLFASGSAG